jgi:hypothetical protein
MLRRITSSLMLLFLIPLNALPPTSPGHETETVLSTYGALSFQCSAKPVMQAAMDDQDFVQERAVQRESDSATPVFEITNIQVGDISAIASQSWSTRFSIPAPGDNNVLKGSAEDRDYSDLTTPQARLHMVSVHWGTDKTYTPERIAAVQHITVGQAVAENSKAHNGGWRDEAATYTKYATFDVTVTFQGRAIGPYTASFFFGKDASGKEVVSPADAVTGSLLFDILDQTGYPSDLLKTKLRQRPVVDHWVQAHRSATCSAIRSDLCCANGKCALPESSVARDLARP